MFLGCNRYTPENRMEDETDRLPKSRRVPPKSKFNDEEATAVLRLIVEQEKILNNATVSPVLNITADKLKRLPPLGASFRESFNTDDELESLKKPLKNGHTQHHDNSAQDAVLCKPTLLRAKEQKEIVDDCGTKLGKAKVPQIYSTPKITRLRDKERPRESYGRTSSHLKPNNRLENRANTPSDARVNRPSNPARFSREDDMTFRGASSPNRSDVLQLSDELLDRPICPAPPRTSSPPSYIN